MIRAAISLSSLAALAWAQACFAAAPAVGRVVIVAPKSPSDSVIASVMKAVQADGFSATFDEAKRIDKAVKEGKLQPSPELVEARSLLAASFVKLRESKRAEVQFAAADRERAALGGNDRLFVSAMVRRIDDLDRQKKPDEAEAMLRQAIAMQKALDGVRTIRVENLELRLVPLLDQIDRSPEAETILAALHADREKRYGPTHRMSLDVERAWADHYEFIGKYVEAEAARFRVYNAVSAQRGLSLVQRVGAPLALAGVLELRDRGGDGELYLKRALAEVRAANPKQDGLEAYLLSRLVKTYRKRKILQAGIADALPGLAAYWEEKRGRNSAKAIAARDDLGEALLKVDPAKAEEIFRAQLAIRSADPKTRPFVLAYTSRKIAEALTKQQRLEDALPLMREDVRLLEQEFGLFSGDALLAREKLAMHILFMDQFDAAEAEFKYILKNIPADPAFTAMAPADMHFRLATAYFWQDKSDVAFAEIEKGLASSRKRDGEGSTRYINVESGAAETYETFGHWKAAEPLRRHVVASWQKLGGGKDPALIEAQTDLGSNLAEQGRTAEATLQYQAAVETARKISGDDGYRTLQAYQELAEYYDQTDRAGDGVAIYRRLYQQSLRKFGPAGASTFVWASNLASRLQGLSEFEEAETLLRNLLKPEAEISLQNRQIVVVLLASVLNFRDKAKEAAQLLNEQIVLLDKEKQVALKEVVQLILVDTYTRLERTDDAIALVSDLHAKKCVNSASENDRNFCKSIIAQYVSLLHNKGRSVEVFPETGQMFAEAETEWRKVTSRDFTRRLRVDDRTAQDTFSDYATYLDVAWAVRAKGTVLTPDQKNNEFVAMQRITASEASKAMAAAAARLSSGTGAVSELVRKQQMLAKDIVALEEDAAKQIAGRIPGDEDGAEQPQKAGSVDQLRVEYETVTKRLSDEFPQYAALASPKTLTISEVQARLGPSEGLLVIAAGDDGFHSLGIGGKTVARSRSKSSFVDIGNAARRLICQMDKTDCSDSLREMAFGGPRTPFENQGYRRFGAADANLLYQELIAPVESAFEGVKTLYVVTDSELGDLPLGLLLTSPLAWGADPADPSALSGAKWLADRYAVVRLPAVGSLERPSGARVPASTAFQGYGDPSLIGNGLSTGSERGLSAVKMTRGDNGYQIADPLLLRNMEPLKGTRTELTALAGLFAPGSAKLHFRDDATETAIKSNKELAQAGVVVFATHGLLPRSVSGLVEPGLLFSPPEEPTGLDDGVLTASEAAQLSFNADILILSACNTASNARGSSDDSLSGLARGFLYAGAKSLLASHWRISDEATAALTVEMITRRQAGRGITRAEALQQAMAAVRAGKHADGTPVANWGPEWVHPSYWAAFSLIANSNE